jgi:hypothetical protein
MRVASLRALVPLLAAASASSRLARLALIVVDDDELVEGDGIGERLYLSCETACLILSTLFRLRRRFSAHCRARRCFALAASLAHSAFSAEQLWTCRL